MTTPVAAERERVSAQVAAEMKHITTQLTKVTQVLEKAIGTNWLGRTERRPFVAWLQKTLHLGEAILRLATIIAGEQTAQPGPRAQLTTLQRTLRIHNRAVRQADTLWVHARHRHKHSMRLSILQQDLKALTGVMERNMSLGPGIQTPRRTIQRNALLALQYNQLTTNMQMEQSRIDALTGDIAKAVVMFVHTAREVADAEARPAPPPAWWKIVQGVAGVDTGEAQVAATRKRKRVHTERALVIDTERPLVIDIPSPKRRKVVVEATVAPPRRPAAPAVETFATPPQIVTFFASDFRRNPLAKPGKRAKPAWAILPSGTRKLRPLINPLRDRTRTLIVVIEFTAPNYPPLGTDLPMKLMDRGGVVHARVVNPLNATWVSQITTVVKMAHNHGASLIIRGRLAEGQPRLILLDAHVLPPGTTDYSPTDSRVGPTSNIAGRSAPRHQRFVRQGFFSLGVGEPVKWDGSFTLENFTIHLGRSFSLFSMTELRLVNCVFHAVDTTAARYSPWPKQTPCTAHKLTIQSMDFRASTVNILEVFNTRESFKSRSLGAPMVDRYTSIYIVNSVNPSFGRHSTTRPGDVSITVISHDPGGPGLPAKIPMVRYDECRWYAGDGSYWLIPSEELHLDVRVRVPGQGKRTKRNPTGIVRKKEHRIVASAVVKSLVFRHCGVYPGLHALDMKSLRRRAPFVFDPRIPVPPITVLPYRPWMSPEELLRRVRSEEQVNDNPAYYRIGREWTENLTLRGPYVLPIVKTLIYSLLFIHDKESGLGTKKKVILADGRPHSLLERARHYVAEFLGPRRTQVSLQLVGLTEQDNQDLVWSDALPIAHIPMSDAAVDEFLEELREEEDVAGLLPERRGVESPEDVLGLLSERRVDSPGSQEDLFDAEFELLDFPGSQEEPFF